MSRWRENYKPIKKGRLIMKKFFELSTKILYSMIICLTLVLVGMVISQNVAAAQEVTLDEGMIKNILCPSNTTNTVKIDNKTYTIYWANKFVDRKSTRLNSSHVKISYAVFCSKKKRWQSITMPDSPT